MGLCFDFLYYEPPGISTPTFNIGVSLFPFIFLSMLLIRAGDQNREMQPRARAMVVVNVSESRRLRKHDDRADEYLLFRGDMMEEKTAWGDWLLGLFGFSGGILPQYYTIIRLITMLDFVTIVFLLIATNFDHWWFRSGSIVIRLMYRWLEFSVLVILCCPLFQLKSNPRLIAFSWTPVLAVGVPLAVVGVLFEIVSWIKCQRAIPQFDLTFGRPTNITHTQEELYHDYLSPEQCPVLVKNWLARDALDCFILLVFALLWVFVRFFNPEEIVPHVSFGLPRFWWSRARGVVVLLPRKGLIPYSLYLLMTRIFRVLGDSDLLLDSDSCGGRFLCWYAIAYIFEQALFALVLFWTLRWDSHFVYGDPEQVSGIRKRLVQLRDDVSWSHEIPWQDIELNNCIGKGQFQVFSAVWCGTPCAVKRIGYSSLNKQNKNVGRGNSQGRSSNDMSTPGTRESIHNMDVAVNELKLLSTLSHPNIVQFFGFCVDVPTLRACAQQTSVNGHHNGSTDPSTDNTNNFATDSYNSDVFTEPYNSDPHNSGGGGFDDNDNHDAAAPSNLFVAESPAVVFKQARRVRVENEPRPTIHAVGGYDVACSDMVEREIWLVMEYLPGNSLFRLIGDRSISLSYTQILRLAIGMCRGLRFLAHRGIVHCDFKSLNVFVGRDLEPKIGDFGEAKLVAGLVQTGGNQTDAVFQANNCFGSSEWMAPEVIKNFTYSQKSDVFSFGVVLWELVTRNRPYLDLKYERIKSKVAAGHRETIPNTCSTFMRECIQNCWAQNPELRPTFAELLGQLETELRQTPGQ